MKKVFNIEVDCAVCAGKCEEAIRKAEGVIDCRINFIMQTMELTANEADFDKVLKRAIKAGRRIEPDFSVEK